MEGLARMLADVFRLDVTEVDAAARAELWNGVRAAHLGWEGARCCGRTPATSPPAKSPCS